MKFKWITCKDLFFFGLLTACVLQISSRPYRLNETWKQSSDFAVFCAFEYFMNVWYLITRQLGLQFVWVPKLYGVRMEIYSSFSFIVWINRRSMPTVVNFTALTTTTKVMTTTQTTMTSTTMTPPTSPTITTTPKPPIVGYNDSGNFPSCVCSCRHVH